MKFGAGKQPFHPAIVGGEPVEVSGSNGDGGALGNLPPGPGEEGSGGVGDDVPRITGGVHDVGSDDFEQDGPADKVGRYFKCGWPGIPRAKVEEVMHEKQRGHRAGDEECVIEPIMKEGEMDVRFDKPAVGGVERAAGQEERVKQVGEPLHSRASMTSPKPRPRRTLSKMVMEQVFQIMARGHRPTGSDE